MKIKKIMSTNIISVNTSSTILEAVKKMHLYNIGFILVVDNDELKGVFSDRDALLSLVKGHTLDDTVDKIMRREVVTAKSNMNDVEAAELMGYYQIKRLVILDDFNKISGVLSLADLANSIESEDLALEALCEISASFDVNSNFVYESDNSFDNDDYEDF